MSASDAPGDPTFDRTTALAVLVMDIYERLIKNKDLTRQEFTLTMNATENAFKKDQPSGAHIVEAIRDFVLEQTKDVK